MSRSAIALSSFFISLVLFAPLTALAGSGLDRTGQRSSCDDPGPYWVEHQYAHTGDVTAQEAAEFCAEKLQQSTILGHAGFVIKWFGGSAPGMGQTGHMTCYACVAYHESNDPFTHGFPPTRTSLDDAISYAVSLIPGEVSKVQIFTAQEGDSGTTGAGYEVTIFDRPTNRYGVVKIDPFTGVPSIVVDRELALSEE